MIEWMKTGFLSSWQDAGRIGFARLGVPPGGPMDPASAELATRLLQKPKGSLVVESHFPGPVLAFHQEVMISLTGADFGAQLSSGRSLYPGGRYRIQQGEVLSFQRKHRGELVYLGFDEPEGLQSWWGSVDQPITKGDTFRVRASILPEKRVGRSLEIDSPVLRFIPRPDRWLHEPGYTFRVLPESNRMGIRLAGEVGVKATPGYSAGVVQGTLQILPNGQLIALMADHQTTGGYPVLGELIRMDLGKLAQTPVGESLHFQPISVEEAWQIQADYDQFMRKLTCSIAL